MSLYQNDINTGRWSNRIELEFVISMTWNLSRASGMAGKVVVRARREIICAAKKQQTAATRNNCAVQSVPQMFALATGTRSNC